MFDFALGADSDWIALLIDLILERKLEGGVLGYGESSGRGDGDGGCGHGGRTA